MAFDCTFSNFNLDSNLSSLISNLEKRYIAMATIPKFSVQNLLPYRISMGCMAIINKANFEILKSFFEVKKILMQEKPDTNCANKI